ncbi:hypothetical protein niasHT_029718 [Heterodera trifolii]|uniref:Cytochrome P450 n=1 Tax=Heterodera trifolii TaxID=157864 RepID=A0ABD2KR38_9BILA
MEIGVGDRFLFVLIISTFAYKILNLPQFFFFFIAIVAAWIIFQYHQKKHWHRLDVPGPNVNIFFGNTIKQIRNGSIDVDRENFSKYGNSFGSFLFDRREFCTKDPEMIRQIFIKEFSHFQNRFDFIPGRKEDAPKSLTRNMINMLRDDDWKRVRNRVTPAFTTGKLKKLIPILCDCTERLCKVFEDEYASKKKEILLKDLYGRFLLDVIGRCGFSLDLNTYEEENVFLEQSRLVFNFGRKAQRIRTILCVFFPLTAKLIENFTGKSLAFAVDEQFFKEMMGELYEKRRADPAAKEKYSDIFQLLMNAVEDDDDEEIANGNGAISADDAQIIHNELRSDGKQQKQGKHLTKIELFAQGFIILVAG